MCIRDSARAQRAARAFADAAPGCVDPETVETNIVVLATTDTGWSAAELVAAAAAQGVRGYAAGPEALRLAWHLDVDDAATDYAIDVIATLLRARPAP